MSPFELEILELIAVNDGTLSWYQIDRALVSSPNSERNLPLLRGLLRVLRELNEEGLISTRPGHIPSQPLYSITARGNQILKARVDVPQKTSL
jgi:hypothetical protein